MLAIKQESGTDPNSQTLSALEANWQSEMERSAVYAALAGKELNANRRNAFRGLAAAEQHHASLWAKSIIALGAPAPAYGQTSKAPFRLESNGHEGIDQVLRRLKSNELADLDRYQSQLASCKDIEMIAILNEAIADESEHYKMLSTLIRARPPIAALTASEAKQSLLNLLAARRKKHPEPASWLSDSLYSANDGLSSIFGVISGVAGATVGNSHFVLLAGLTGTIASALSNGTGAYLSSRSDHEVFRAGFERERVSVQEDEAEAREILALSLQSRGLPAEAVSRLVHFLAEDQERLIQALARTQLNTTEEGLSVPWAFAATAGLATACGAILPVIPFFFVSGTRAIILAAIISLVAHFGLGAARALTTTRPWWSTALELTGIGAFQGATTYGLGMALGWMVSIR